MFPREKQSLSIAKNSIQKGTYSQKIQQKRKKRKSMARSATDECYSMTFAEKFWTENENSVTLHLTLPYVQ